MSENLEEYSVMAKAILQDMETALEDYEADPTKFHKFQEYSDYAGELRKGAAQYELKQVMSMCELGQVIGSKTALSENPGLSNIVAGILFDMCDLLNILFDDVVDGTDKKKDFNIAKFVDRLKWLSGKFKEAPAVKKEEAGSSESSSVSASKVDDDDDDEDDLDSLLDDFDF